MSNNFTNTSKSKKLQTKNPKIENSTQPVLEIKKMVELIHIS